MARVPQTDAEKRLFYSTSTFRMLLDCLARPGTINTLAYPDFLGTPPTYTTASSTSTPINFYALAALLTLLDKEVTFAVVADGQWQDVRSSLARWLTLRSGASVAPLAQAQFVLFCSGTSHALLCSLNMGTLVEPESSATALYCVEELAHKPDVGTDGSRPGVGEASCTPAADAIHRSLHRVELRGPGIAGQATLHIAGLASSELEHIAATRQGYPLGVDVYLIDAQGRCVGLPRTTRISRR